MVLAMMFMVFLLSRLRGVIDYGVDYSTSNVRCLLLDNGENLTLDFVTSDSRQIEMDMVY